MAADDLLWTGPDDGFVDGPTPQVGPASVLVTGAVGRRVGDEDPSLGAVCQQSLRLLLRQVPTPGTEGRNGYAPPEAKEAVAPDLDSVAVKGVDMGVETAGRDEFFVTLAVPRDQDHRHGRSRQEVDDGLEAGAHRGKIAGADEDIRVGGAADQVTRSPFVSVDIGEGKRSHDPSLANPGV